MLTGILIGLPIGILIGLAIPPIYKWVIKKFFTENK